MLQLKANNKSSQISIRFFKDPDPVFLGSDPNHGNLKTDPKSGLSRYTRVKQENAALTARIHMLEEHIREIEVRSTPDRRLAEIEITIFLVTELVTDIFTDKIPFFVFFFFLPERT